MQMGSLLKQENRTTFFVEHANDAIIYSGDGKKRPCISLVNVGNVCK